MYYRYQCIITKEEMFAKFSEQNAASLNLKTCSKHLISKR